jgi:hypothetical protein
MDRRRALQDEHSHSNEQNARRNQPEESPHRDQHAIPALLCKRQT